LYESQFAVPRIIEVLRDTRSHTRPAA
jgi:hypothetical protein